MDPVTHGITGALLGKGYFSERYGRVATFAATLGAVFPDIDTVADAISRDPLAIVRYHRAITHSFLALPFFALLLAWLTRWIARRLSIESPSLPVLTLIYAVGIASHILLDGMTSFGTRMWFPLSSKRVAWDLLFIIDFTFTSIVLLPQIVAWTYSDRAKSRARAIRMWALFAVGAFVVWVVTRSAGYPFHIYIVGVASIALALLFFAPAAGDWGFHVSRAAWCQIGACAMVAYLLACAVGHHVAMLRGKVFADENHIVIDRIAALPIPPSLLGWGSAIRSPDGIYESQFDLRQAHPAGFTFSTDSPPDAFIARAFRLPEVQLYWQFARFPTVASFANGGYHVVELGENRFSDGRRRRPQPFTYHVDFDDDGNVIDQGWLTDGMLRRQIRRLVPQQTVPKAPTPSKNVP